MSAPSRTTDDPRDEYDFSRGVRGKYAERYADGTNVVVLDPDVAEDFKTSQEVNEAQLIGSLDPDQPDEDVEAAWADEIGRRIEEVDAGTAELVPADEAVAQLQATIARAQEGSGWRARARGRRAARRRRRAPE